MSKSNATRLTLALWSSVLSFRPPCRYPTSQLRNRVPLNSDTFLARQGNLWVVIYSFLGGESDFSVGWLARPPWTRHLPTGRACGQPLWRCVTCPPLPDLEPSA